MELRVIALFVCLFAVAVCDQDRPSYIDCVDSNECGKSHCCSIDMVRYAIPTCRARPVLGESCRPGNKPSSYNFSYPNGDKVALLEVYTSVCPCDEGLVCSPKKGVCERQ